MRTILCIIAAIIGFSLSHTLWGAGIVAGLVWILIAWVMGRRAVADKMVFILDPTTGEMKPQAHDRATRRYLNGRDQ